MFKGVTTSIIRTFVVVIALVMTTSLYAQDVDTQRSKRDFDLGRSTEILANMMRELESGYVEDIEADALLDAAAR